MTVQDDVTLILVLSSSASLDASPKHNWVEDGGGLPPYVRKLARGIMKSGKSKSAAIAIAISRIKKWAAGGSDVDAGTRAKAAKAVSQWEALKAKHGSKKVVAASRHDNSEYLMFSNIGSFNTDLIRTAWNSVQDKLRAAERAEARAKGLDPYESNEARVSTYTYIRELWTDYVIVEIEGRGGPAELAKVPYTVDSGNVSFGEPVEVEQQYVEVEDDDDDDLSELEAALLGDVLVLSSSRLDYLSSIAKR